MTPTELREAAERVFLGSFRLGWLEEANKIWASRDTEDYDADLLTWVARAREMLTECKRLQDAIEHPADDE